MFLNDIVTVHTDNEGESQRTFCYTLIIEEGSQRKMCYTDHWEEKSKDNDTHWALRGNLKGQINTVWSLSGNLKGCCYMYTLTFDGGSQKMLLHINNKRNSRMLIQILRGDLTHVFTHQHWGWVTTGKFVYSHSSFLFLSTHILASRSEGRALNLCILCWLAPNVPTQLIIPPKVSAQNVWRTVGSKSKL